MNPPVITLIVPGHDVAAFAQEALDSLRSQTRPDWTAILVDDASTDGTLAIFEAAARADRRFTVMRHDTQRGLSAARNTGLDAVTTALVGFLDADDVMDPRALERLVAVLDASGSDFAVGAYVRLNPDAAGAYSPGAVQPWVARATDPERRATTLVAHPEAAGNIVAWSKVSRTDLWRRLGLRFPEGQTFEDQVVAQRMYTGARTLDVIPDVVVQWRSRADGTSITQRKNTLPVLRDYLAALAAGLDVLETAGYSAAVDTRVRLIHDMDVRDLVGIARDHPQDAYRRTLGAFARDLIARRTTVPPSQASSIAALW